MHDASTSTRLTNTHFEGGTKFMMMRMCLVNCDDIQSRSKSHRLSDVLPSSPRRHCRAKNNSPNWLSAAAFVLRTSVSARKLLLRGLFG